MGKASFKVFQCIFSPYGLSFPKNYLLCIRLLVTPWIVALQAPLSMGFPRQEYWSGLSFSYQGDLPDPGIKPMSPPLAGRFFTTEPPGKLPPPPNYLGADIMHRKRYSTPHFPSKCPFFCHSELTSANLVIISPTFFLSCLRACRILVS